eukprot:6191907-Pleurochrysis_carterae.AAC.1
MTLGNDIFGKDRKDPKFLAERQLNPAVWIKLKAQPANSLNALLYKMSATSARTRRSMYKKPVE